MFISAHVEQAESVSSHDRSALHCGKTNQGVHRDAEHFQSAHGPEMWRSLGVFFVVVFFRILVDATTFFGPFVLFAN